MSSRSIWPSPEQELLLQAALTKGPGARQAWAQWIERVDLNLLDPGSNRLLPLVYHNLKKEGIEHDIFQRLKGVYRYTWTKNQMLFHAITPVLNRFHGSGIRTMILKGAALIVRYYFNFGLRPMNDFDVLVRDQDVRSAIDLLNKSGWKPVNQPFQALTEEYFRLNEAHSFNNADGQWLDLHWHLLPKSSYPGGDDEFWENAVPARVNEESSQILSPADQLLHACIHGTKWHSPPMYNWMADAVVIMNTAGPEIDWDRFIDYAQKPRLLLAVRTVMNYLREALQAPVPPPVLQAINRRPVSRVERLEFKYRTHPPETALGYLWSLWIRYSFQARQGHQKRTLFGFAVFIKTFLSEDSWWRVPFIATYKFLRRAFRGFFV